VKRRLPITAILAGVVLFAASCGKTDGLPLPKLTPESPPTREILSSPGLPLPLPNDPDVPKGAEPPLPVAGGARDISNAALKTDGSADPRK
jgi:hypothetical protein